MDQYRNGSRLGDHCLDQLDAHPDDRGNLLLRDSSRRHGECEYGDAGLNLPNDGLLPNNEDHDRLNT